MCIFTPPAVTSQGPSPKTNAGPLPAPPPPRPPRPAPPRPAAPSAVGGAPGTGGICPAAGACGACCAAPISTSDTRNSAKVAQNATARIGFDERRFMASPSHAPSSRGGGLVVIRRLKFGAVLLEPRSLVLQRSGFE